MDGEELLAVMNEFKERFRNDGEEAACEYWNSQELTRYIGPILKYWVRGLIATTEKGVSRKLNKQIVLVILRLAGMTDAYSWRTWLLWRRATGDSSILGLRQELSYEAALDDGDEDDDDNDEEGGGVSQCQQSGRAKIEWKRTSHAVEMPEDLEDALGVNWADWAIEHQPQPQPRQQGDSAERSQNGE